MNRIRILALIAAILTAISVFLYLQSQNKPVQVVTAAVVVSSQTIPEHTQITADMLKVIQLPPEAILPDAARSIEEVVGSTAISQIESGEQVLYARLIKKDEVKGGLSYQIPDKMRAMTISVDEVTGVAGFIGANDTVDVMVLLDYSFPVVDPATNQSPMTRSFSFLLLQDVTVLAVGNSGQNAPGQNNTGYSTVTLLVSPEDAAKVNLASQRGSLRLILRSTNDHVKITPEPEIPETLLEPIIPGMKDFDLNQDLFPSPTPQPSPTPAVPEDSKSVA